MALDYIRRASRTLRESQDAFRAEDYPLTVRRAQEAVELSLKAALRYLAIEYPREHDVSDALLELVHSRELPQWFMTEIEFMASVSSDLSGKRGLAFYGDEQVLTPPSSLFTMADAQKALKDAERVHENCRRLLGV